MSGDGHLLGNRIYRNGDDISCLSELYSMGVGPPDKILKFADGWIIELFFPLFNRLIAIETLPGFGQTWCMHQRGLLDDSREQACLRDTHKYS